MTEKNYPKVLVVSPTYEGKDYIFQENWECIKNFDYPNYDYVYIDNSKGDSYTKTLRKRGAKVIHVPRGSNSRQALCNAQNYARNRVLTEGYEYLMFVESDLLPEKHAITKLLSYSLPVVGATYYIGHEVKLPCLFILEPTSTGQMGTRLVGTKINDKGQVINIDYKVVNDFINKGLRQIHGMGLGCTLIRADIIKRFPFWYDGRFDNKHSDVYFYMDLHNNHIPVFADTDYIIEHRPSKWSNVEDR
jgi:glycosyltransferase involved in cell wall biosynthesis